MIEGVTIYMAAHMGRLLLFQWSCTMGHSHALLRPLRPGCSGLQTFACQPQALEGEEGGSRGGGGGGPGGVPPPHPTVYGRSNTSLGGTGYLVGHHWSSCRPFLRTSGGYFIMRHHSPQQTPIPEAPMGPKPWAHPLH